MDFAERFKELRIQNHLKQSELANTLALSTRHIQNYEYGTRTPDYKTLLAIADYFNVSLDYLCGRSDQRSIAIFKDLSE